MRLVLMFLTLTILLSSKSLAYEGVCRGVREPDIALRISGDGHGAYSLTLNHGFLKKVEGLNVKAGTNDYKIGPSYLLTDVSEFSYKSDSDMSEGFYLWRQQSRPFDFIFTLTLRAKDISLDKGQKTYLAEMHVKKDNAFVSGKTGLNATTFTETAVSVQCDLALPPERPENNELQEFSQALQIPEMFQSTWKRYFQSSTSLPFANYFGSNFSNYSGEAPGFCRSILGDFYELMTDFRAKSRTLDRLDLAGLESREDILKELRKSGEKITREIRAQYELGQKSADYADCFQNSARSYLAESLSVLLTRSISMQQKGLRTVGEGNELMLLGLALLNSMPEKFVALTPDNRSSSSCPFQKQIEIDGKIQYAILGGYDCETGIIYFDPFQNPLNLAATFVHEIDHLLRDKETSNEGFPNIETFVLLDETLAAVSAAYVQKSFSSVARGKLQIPSSPNYLDPNDTVLSFYRGNGVFSKLFDTYFQKQNHLGLYAFLDSIFRFSTKGEMLAEARNFFNEISQIYFNRKVQPEDFAWFESLEFREWAQPKQGSSRRTLGATPIASWMAHLEFSFVSQKPVGLLEGNSDKIYFISNNSMKYETNLPIILRRLQILEASLKKPTSSTCATFIDGLHSPTQLQGYLGKSSGELCEGGIKPRGDSNGHGIVPNGHAVIPSYPIRFCIQPGTGTGL